MIQYEIENDLDVHEFRSVLINSTLGERRPIDDIDRLKDMLLNCQLIITARNGEQLVGVARSISDFSYCTYLSDLAVDLKYQKQGIGKELIRQTKLHTGKALLLLLSAPAAKDYYPRVGMSKHPECFYIRDAEELT